MLILVVVAAALSGCMYPDSEKVANATPYADQLASVQNAVDQYREDTGGLVPIKESDADMDIFIKYRIDFAKLVPKYMEKAPTNAYEKGGIFQYVIWDPENTAEVKLVDLNAPERMREIRIRATAFKYMPMEGAINDFAFKPDYKKLGYDKPLTFKSPYSGVELPIFFSGDGELYVDYSIDLNQILQEDKPDVKPGDDIRQLLIDKSPILPAYSIKYTVDENNEPVMVNPKKEKNEGLAGAQWETTEEPEETQE